MLDLLLNAPKDKRRTLIRKLKKGAKERIFNQIYTMTEELDLDQISDYETRVKMRHELIQRFPDMVFWDSAEYANSRFGKGKHDAPDLAQLGECKLSTRGDIVILTKSGRLLVHPAGPRGAYFIVRWGSIAKTRHRLLASTFIPRPDNLKHISYRHLQINHIDSIPGNDLLCNLEWVTVRQNIRHHFHQEHYGDIKYLLFRVAVNNTFMGRTFVLSEYELHLVGTNFNRLKKEMEQGTKGRYRGMDVSMIHYEDIQNFHVGFPDDIAELFNRNKKYFNTQINPIIGTVLWGKYRGFEFSLYGHDEINQHFRRTCVEAVARGRSTTCRGCDFRFATHADAIPLHGKLTQEIAEDARRSKKRINAKDP